MKIVKFRVYADKRHYYQVLIFPDKNTMYKYRKTLAGELVGQKVVLGRTANNYEAEVICLYHKERNKPIGQITFYPKSSKCSGVVSHEMAHATQFYWMGYVRYKWNDIIKKERAQEKFAQILGELVRQYWVKWFRYFEPK